MNKIELKKYTEWLKNKYVSPPSSEECLIEYFLFTRRNSVIKYEEIVASYFKMTVAEIFNHERNTESVFKRQLIFYIYKINGFSEFQISNLFNYARRTIYFSIESIKNYLSTDKKKSIIINEILSLIK